MTWTTPADLIDEVERLWSNGRILGAIVSGEPLFPRRLKLRGPDSKTMASRFGDVQDWIQALDNSSRSKRGFGYEIAWTEVNHRQLGRNRVPLEVSIPTEDDALRLIGKNKAADKFRELAPATLTLFPMLAEWLARRPLTVIDHAEDWARVLSVVTWLRDHPRSGLYLRQLDIPGVDTKFIEGRKGFLSELVALVLGADERDDKSRGAAGFERRHGFRTKPALVRFRVLDSQLRIGGCTDLSVPAAEFAALEIHPSRVFVTENEINGLAFPDLAGGIVIFGLGYGIELLSGARWLLDRPLHYWGDIDTHGFAMLSRLRSSLPHAQALLMDRATLLSHRALWGCESSPHVRELAFLTEEEFALYDDLRCNRLGHGVRLEQERIPYSRVIATLAEIA
jgi:hypothetical protein